MLNAEDGDGRLGFLILHGLLAVTYSAVGAAVVLVTVFVVYLNNRTDLQVWHLAKLDQEFKAESGIETFEEYLALSLQSHPTRGCCCCTGCPIPHTVCAIWGNVSTLRARM